MKRLLHTVLIIGVLFLTTFFIQPQSFATYEPSSVSSLESLPTPTGLYWDGLSMKWANMTIAVPNLDEYELKFYFSQTGTTGAMIEMDMNYSYTRWDLNHASFPSLLETFVTDYGTGYYYFKVRAITKDVHVAANSEWSELSPAYYYEMPNRLPTPSGLYWDGTYMKWAEYGSTIRGADYVHINVYYRDPEASDAALTSVTGRGTSGPDGDFIPLDLSTDPDLKTGYYYFTVELGSRDITVALNSLVSELSPAYYYEAPQKLPAPTGLYWDDNAFMRWDNMDDPLVASYEIEVYYGAPGESNFESLKQVDTLYNVGSLYQWNGLIESCIEDHGAGYYYFRVKATPYISSVSATTSEWSELSSAYYFDGTVGEKLSIPTGLKWDETAVCWDGMHNAEDTHIIYAVNYYFGESETGVDAYHVNFADLPYCPDPSLIVEFPFFAEPVKGSVGYCFFKVRAISNNIVIASSSDYSMLSPGYYTGIRTGTCGDNLTWTLDNITNTLIISGTGAMYDYYNNDMPWGTIIKTVLVEEGVTSIGAYAFEDCALLTKVELPTSMKYIGYGAFRGCSALSEVVYSATAEKWMKIDLDWENDDLARAYLSTNSLSGTCGDNLTWTLDSSGVLIISGTGEMLGTDWQEYQDHWGSDEFPWDNYREYITTIVLGEGITTIGDDAFWGCTNVTDMVIPEGVCRIGGDAFGRCTALTEITIPVSVELIEYSAFYECSALSNVNYAGTLANWNSIRIEECNEMLQNAYLASNIISGTCGENLFWTLNGTTKTLSILGSGMMSDYSPWGSSSTAPWFPYRDNIQNVVFSEGITYIGENAFYSCSSLENVTLPLSLATVGYRAFANCPTLAAFIVPEEHEGFRADNGILFSKDGSTLVVFPSGYASTSYAVPNTVTAIADYAFCGCGTLTEVTLPIIVREIGDCAFSGCRSLESINIPNTVTAINYGTFFGCYNLPSVDIPETVISIGSQAFYDCSNLDGIQIPAGVTSIGDRAFKYCSNLSAINLPEGISAIEEHTFYTCSRLASVTLPSTLISIGDEAFHYCQSLKNITIPASMTSLGYHVFEQCSSMESFVVSDGNPVYQSIEGALISKEDSELLYYPAGNPRTVYSIPTGIVTISDYAFYDADYLKTILIPASTINLGGIPSNLEFFLVTEGNPAYRSIEGILFSEDGTELLRYPIKNPRTVYSIPDGVKIISEYAFGNAGNLQNIIIPEGVTILERYSFNSCEGLASITIPGTVETISRGAFYDCTGLLSVILENGVAVIEQDAFAWCENLQEVQLPLTLSEVGHEAFYQCTSLERVSYDGTETLWETVLVGTGNNRLEIADFDYSNPDALQAGWSKQTGELRLCGVHEDADIVMVAFYNQNEQLERIESFTADEVAAGVLIAEINDLHTVKILQTDENFAPATNFVVPG